jgi:hypothetical protein
MSDHMQRCLQAYYTQAFPIKQGPIRDPYPHSVELHGRDLLCVC